MIGNRKPQTPTPGQIVMLHEAESTQASVAIVTYVWSPTSVNLVVFDPEGNQPPLNAKSVAFSPDGTQPQGSSVWATPPGLPARVEPAPAEAADSEV